MSNPILSLIESRASINYYDPDRSISESDIEALVAMAVRAPSAYNLQNWKFIAVRSAEAKARLKKVAFGQQKVIEASVTFIICGLLNGYEKIEHALQPSVSTGLMQASMAEGWVKMVTESHHENPALQRDEAFRSASLAAMTLMLAAQGMELASCAMSGFDAQALSQAFGLNKNEVPVMLVTVGYPLENNWVQKPRCPLEEVMTVI